MSNFEANAEKYNAAVTSTISLWLIVQYDFIRLTQVACIRASYVRALKGQRNPAKKSQPYYRPTSRVVYVYAYTSDFRQLNLLRLRSEKRIFELFIFERDEYQLLGDLLCDSVLRSFMEIRDCKHCRIIVLQLIAAVKAIRAFCHFFASHFSPSCSMLALLSIIPVLP